ncbi:NAD(P)/FAD-dependent oxidoreductase [Nocardia amamiensis]|uniref:NAD(P)/FAD-dependent oxidoreductase n=1 Tax=Nocardia amamiensis TaxID=404578 RepID=A0ABS0D0T3_9NOCA|nr:NAD(P)/FAD-dependent oxidoreductase [Nocardia amamiensis]MBF6302385.1 NAD(P)/FAD-dependent oxidoreductase [Nocardia amamiensis]
MADETQVDVVVVGGGAAGLSAALTLVRARRSVVVIDALEPRNGPAAGVHGWLTRDGMPPTALVAAGAREVEQYGGRIVYTRAESARRTPNGFVVDTDRGSFRGRRLLVASGLVDELPTITGVRERWGRDVVHCPYCHGWEIRDRPIGVLGSVHHALLFRQWSTQVTLLRHSSPPPSTEQSEQLAARGIAVVDGVVSALEIVDDRLAGARLDSGRLVPIAALAIAPRLVTRDTLLLGLGVETAEHASGIHVAADIGGRTSVPGVWVAGNVADIAAGVVQAAASGVTAGAAINADLIEEDTRQAVDRWRAGGFSADAERATSQRVPAARRHGLDSLLPMPPS